MASPSLVDPNFIRAVVYVLDHDEAGTIGVVLNRPSGTPVADVVPHWALIVANPTMIFSGGPVSVNGAICIARVASGAAPLAASQAGENVSGQPRFQAVTPSLGTVDLHAAPEDITVRLAEARVFAGYSGWGPGQLDGELDAGAWFVLDALDSDVFDEDPATLWSRVLRRQGGWFGVLSRHPLDPSVN